MSLYPVRLCLDSRTRFLPLVACRTRVGNPQMSHQRKSQTMDAESLGSCSAPCIVGLKHWGVSALSGVSGCPDVPLTSGNVPDSPIGVSAHMFQPVP